MKTILVIFLCIANSQCGVLKDDSNKPVTPSNAEHRIVTVQLTRVVDYFDYGNNATLLTDILIDVTKDKEETQPTESETRSFNLSPGLHKWEVKFLRSAQPVEEMNRILNIVEATAKKTGQLISKNCTNGETDFVCHFNINIDATNQQLSKKHKREIQKNAQPTDIEEINRLIKFAEAAENKNGKDCRTVDGAVICHVYIPEDAPKQKHKREIESQNNTTPADEDEIKQILEIMEAAEDKLNCTTITEENLDSCNSDKSDFIADECPTGQGRADDGTCVPEIEFE